MGEPETLRPVGVVRATEVTVLVASLRQTPFTAKHPVAKLIPLEKEDVAASLMYEAVPMPKRDEAVRRGKVEVAEVEVATKYPALA